MIMPLLRDGNELKLSLRAGTIWERISWARHDTTMAELFE